MALRLVGKTTDDNKVHPSSVLLPAISDRLVGSMIDSNEKHSPNANELIFVIVVGMVTDLSK